MRVTGVIKEKVIGARKLNAGAHSAIHGLLVSVLSVLSDSVVVEFQNPESSNTLEKVYSWFQETSGTGKAPFPDGTLLGYSIHTDEEKKPQTSSESELD